MIFQSIVCGHHGHHGHHVQSPVEEVIKLEGGLLPNMLEMVARNVLEQDFQNDYVIEEDVQQVQMAILCLLHYGFIWFGKLFGRNTDF